MRFPCMWAMSYFHIKMQGYSLNRLSFIAASSWHLPHQSRSEAIFQVPQLHYYVHEALVCTTTCSIVDNFMFGCNLTPYCSHMYRRAHIMKLSRKKTFFVALGPSGKVFSAKFWGCGPQNWCHQAIHKVFLRENFMKVSPTKVSLYTVCLKCTRLDILHVSSLWLCLCVL